MHVPEHILEIEHNISWLPQPNMGQIILSASVPAQELVVTSMVLAFMGDAMLQTRLGHRGWDIPGGHIEPGETVEEAARRELYEETGAQAGPLHVLGFQRLHLYGPRPELYPYPYPISHQLFYWTRISDLGEFVPTTESLERGLFSPEEARKTPWVQKHLLLYEVALQAASSI